MTVRRFVKGVLTKVTTLPVTNCDGCGAVDAYSKQRRTMKTTRPLTDRQAEVLAYLRSEAEEGRTPSLKEIGKHFGFDMTRAHQLLLVLNDKGHIYYAHGKARAYLVLALQRSIPVLTLEQACALPSVDAG